MGATGSTPTASVGTGFPTFVKLDHGKRSTKYFTRIGAVAESLVTTSKGRIRGGELGGGIAFLGVPYAQPPVGQLRWAAPQEMFPWANIRDCLCFGPSCPQACPPDARGKVAVPPDYLKELQQSRDGTTHYLPPGLDEDCLQLNVFTPCLGDGQRRPTIVWIHGGNLTCGAASAGVALDPAARIGNNPAYFAVQHDVVVVTVTYRLNVFGFLNLEGGTANCGLLDVVAALRWVNKEICKFGGDPGNITLSGISAGSHICSQLMCLPAADGLFHKVICMSGSAQWSLGSQQDHDRRVAKPFAQKLGFPSLKDMTLEKARDIPAEVLRKAYLESGAFLESGSLSVDGSTVPADPLEMMRAGCAKGIPVLSGVTRDEGVFSAHGLRRQGAGIDAVVDALAAHFGEACYLMNGDVDALRGVSAEARTKVAEEMVADYCDLVSRYRDAPKEAQQRSVCLDTNKCPAAGDEHYELAVKVLGDHDFTLAHLMAIWSLSHHGPVYSYVFSDESAPGERLAFHTADAPFLFGNHPDAQLGGPGHELSCDMGEAWAAFARSGNPSTPALGTWPPVSFPSELAPGKCLPEAPSHWEHMNFESGRTGMVSFGSEEMRIWCKHALRLAQLSRDETMGPAVPPRPALQALAGSLFGLE